MISNVFVYGTLKTGQCREKCWPRTPVKIVKGWIEATLYDTGPHPAIDVGADLVAGELWMFSAEDIEVVLKDLDVIEDYQAGRTEGNQYDRRVASCETVEGERWEAFTYYYACKENFRGFRRLMPVHEFAGRRFAVWPEGADW